MQIPLNSPASGHAIRLYLLLSHLLPLTHFIFFMVSWVDLTRELEQKWYRPFWMEVGRATGWFFMFLSFFVCVLVVMEALKQDSFCVTKCTAFPPTDRWTALSMCCEWETNICECVCVCSPLRFWNNLVSAYPIAICVPSDSVIHSVQTKLFLSLFGITAFVLRVNHLL